MPSTKEDDKMARADVEIRPAGTMLADDLRLEALGCVVRMRLAHG